MTTTRKTEPTPPTPDTPEGEDAFRKFLEETELDDEDEAAIRERIDRYKESIPDGDPEEPDAER